MHDVIDYVDPYVRKAGTTGKTCREYVIPTYTGLLDAYIKNPTHGTAQAVINMHKARKNRLDDMSARVDAEVDLAVRAIYPELLPGRGMKKGLCNSCWHSKDGEREAKEYAAFVLAEAAAKRVAIAPVPAPAAVMAPTLALLPSRVRMMREVPHASREYDEADQYACVVRVAPFDPIREGTSYGRCAAPPIPIAPAAPIAAPVAPPRDDERSFVGNVGPPTHPVAPARHVVRPRPGPGPGPLPMPHPGPRSGASAR